MYLKKEDHAYFMGLFNGLSEKGQQKLLETLRMASGERSGADISKIKVIDDAIYDVQAIDPSELITRTMVKKAYKAAKEGK
jgi:hypothetical protein